MGIFSKIKQLLEGARAKELEEEKKLELSKLGEFVQLYIRDSISRDKKGAVQISQNIISKFSEIAKTANSLKDTEPYAKGRFPDQIISAGRSSKDFFCRQVGFVVTKLTLPSEHKIIDYKSLSNFKEKVIAALTQLSLDPKKAELFMLCFEKEAEFIRNKLGEVKKQANNLANLLNKNSVLFKSTELQVILNKATEIEKELKNKNLDKLSAQLKELEETQQNIDRRIEKLSTVKADKLTAEISSVQKSKREWLSRLSNEFTALRKVLKKYQHGEPKATKGELDDYIEDFAETLLADSELKILKILGEIKTAIIENKILLDSKARDKALTVIRLLSKDYVGNMQNQYNTLVEKLDKLEQQRKELLTPVKKEGAELEKQQRELSIQITEVAGKIKAKMRHRESKDKELVQLKSEIEELASDLVKIRIHIT